MHLYLVRMDAAVLNGSYYIVAESFDAAAAMASEIDQSTGGESAVRSVERLVSAGGPEAGFTMTNTAAESLGFS